jgi:osmotically-inducible protein OsmY
MRKINLRMGLLALGILTIPLLAGPQSPAAAASDAWIQTQLVTTYGLNEHLNPFAIDVAVRNGDVALTGEVDTGIEKDLAGQIAKSVDGVKSVKNDLLVVGQSGREREPSAFYRAVTDATLTAKVKSNLLWNEHVSGTDIAVSSENGVVTLEGSVGSEAERDLAVQLSRNTGGVESVQNRLTVQKSEETEASMVDKATTAVGNTFLTGKVKAALMSSKGMEGSDVSVSSDGGTVTLTGTVRSKEQENHVLEVVNNVESVENVVSNLQIQG